MALSFSFIPLVSLLALLAGPPGGAATADLDRGEQLYRQGDIAGPLAAFDAAAKADPKDARPHYLRGVALEKKGDPSGAMAAYRQAIARKADFAEAHNGAGALLQAKGDQAAAAAEFEAAITAKPT